MAVLIKGQSIKCTQKSHDHYLCGKENERITVLDVSGFATKNAREALEIIELSAKGTKCNKPVYSAKINPEPDRPWTKQEALQAIEMLEKNLGLTGHARVVVEHLKKGRVHYHVLWDRRPSGNGPAKNMGNDYAIHQKTQREIEKAFKLRPMMAKGRDFKHWEVEWAKRYGYDIFKLREQITADFNGVRSGQSFMAALESKGIVLCRGDKSQFVIILPWGQHKALSSMIHGRPTKAVLRRALSDIDITKLPTVAEGKKQVQARLPKAISKGQAKVRKSNGAFRGKILRSPERASQQRPVVGRYPVAGQLPLAKRTGIKTNPERYKLNHNAVKPISSFSTKLKIGLTTKPSSVSAKNTVTLPQILPQRPTSHNGMSAAQLADYMAACEGKITWRQYFQKWGGGLSL